MSLPINSPDSAVTSEPPRTRSGRVSKPPVRYEPVEQVEDDYSDAEYDSHESDTCDDDVSEVDSDEEDDEEDADDDGNLDGFVVPDKSESDEEGSSDGEPPVPKAKRTPVKKRPVRK